MWYTIKGWHVCVSVLLRGINVASLFMLRQSHFVFCYQRHSLAAFRLCFQFFSFFVLFFAMFRFFFCCASFLLLCVKVEEKIGKLSSLGNWQPSSLISKDTTQRFRGVKSIIGYFPDKKKFKIEKWFLFNFPKM